MTTAPPTTAPATAATPPASTLTQYRRACASAWLCLRRPAFLLPSLGAVMLFAILMVTGMFMSANRPGGSRMTDPPTYLADLAHPDALTILAGGIVSITGSAVLAVAAAHMAGPFAHGTVRIQLVRQPRRSIWLLGHLSMVALLSIVLTVAAVLGVVIAAYVAAIAYDVPTGEWMTGASLGPLAVKTANLAGCIVGFAMLGATFAVFLRSAIATIGIGLCYAVFESLIGGLFGAGQRFLPAANLSAVATHGTKNIPYAWAIVASCLIVAIVVGAALAVLRRRDVLD